MAYWYIEKVTSVTLPVSGDITGWDIEVKDRDSNATAHVAYNFPTSVGPDYDDGVKPLMIEAGYCPGDFGDCE
jgi:hypothetical protein